MFRLIITLLFLGAALGVPAQSTLFSPRNLQKAYDKGTRDAGGKPGPNYWQNRASYTIEASLDLKKRHIKGEATITYVNNSPDRLTIIRLKLLHDLYRKGGQRDNDINPADIDEGVTIEALTYNGLQEFYNDFSDYDVRISLPKDYMLWATGEWQNAGAILEAPFLDRYNSAHTAAEVVNIFTETEQKAGGVFKKARQHVFHYKATGIPYRARTSTGSGSPGFSSGDAPI